MVNFDTKVGTWKLCFR